VPLLVTGSIGIDTVITPRRRVEGVLGGSAVYFAFAAAHYVPVRLVAVVGEDFPGEFSGELEARNIDLAGLEVRKGSRTFRWTGRYSENLNERDTIEVELNVLAEDGPRVPAAFADSDTVFLANTHPTQQRTLIAGLNAPKAIVMDTMDLWIENERDSLLQTLGMVHGVILNDAEAVQLTGKLNLVEAGEDILRIGPRFVVIKKGAHGALLVTGGGVTAIPAYPCRDVCDPTGAGDSFAGGFLGYLAERGGGGIDDLRNALVHGTVVASFAIEDFSIGRLKDLAREEIDRRAAEFANMLRFL